MSDRLLIRLVSAFGVGIVVLVQSSCNAASQESGRPQSEREQPPPIITWPDDPSCAPLSWSDSGLDGHPGLMNRSEVWDSAMAEYNRTGRETEAVVSVYVQIDEHGMPVCAAPRSVVGDSLLRTIAVRAALLSRWTPASRAGRAIESGAGLGFSLCREDAIEIDQHMKWCAPPRIHTTDQSP